MESIECCVAGTMGFGGGDSLVRIGPRFAEELKSERGVYQGQWTARQDRIITRGNRANTFQRAIDQIEQFEQPGICHSGFDQRLGELFHASVSNFVDWNSPCSQIPTNAKLTFLFGNHEFADEIAAAIAKDQRLVQWVEK